MEKTISGGAFCLSAISGWAFCLSKVAIFDALEICAYKPEADRRLLSRDHPAHFSSQETRTFSAVIVLESQGRDTSGEITSNTPVCTILGRRDGSLSTLHAHMSRCLRHSRSLSSAISRERSMVDREVASRSHFSSFFSECFPSRLSFREELLWAILAIPSKYSEDIWFRSEGAAAKRFFVSTFGISALDSEAGLPFVTPWRSSAK
mmetsp:Transcript_8957/g.22046  ORF Transcript_8957/g.22046 Transcript_8957/m.22046 type:complete len:206 (+) Transcript_8957:1622-2239(+)